MVDLLNNEVRAERAERAAVRARTIRDFDMSDSSDGEESEEDEDDDVELPDTEALVTAHGAFVPPDGCKAMKPGCQWDGSRKEQREATQKHEEQTGPAVYSRGSGGLHA